MLISSLACEAPTDHPKTAIEPAQLLDRFCSYISYVLPAVASTCALLATVCDIRSVVGDQATALQQGAESNTARGEPCHIVVVILSVVLTVTSKSIQDGVETDEKPLLTW